MQCWKMKGEEENLLKNQILIEKHNFKQEHTKVLKQFIFNLTQKIVNPKLQKWLDIIDTETKCKDWFIPKLTRSESEEYLENEPVGAFVVRMGRSKQYLALTLSGEDCA